MKKHLQLTAILLAIGAFLFAQEKTEVSITVVKDGKVVKDTTYAFDDAKKAKHAVHMMDAMASGEDKMMIHDKDQHVLIKSDKDMKKHKEHMVFISEDGEKVELLGDHSENVVWVSEDDEDGNIKVIVKKIGDEDCTDGKKKVMKKEVIMISGEDGEKGDWTIKEIKGEDGEVIVIKKKKGEDGEEEIEVEVISKKMKEEQKKMVKKEEIEKKEKQKKEK